MAEAHPVDRATTAHRPWAIYAGTILVALCVAGLVIGAVILPLAQQPTDPLDAFQAICRALGISVPQEPPGEAARRPKEPASLVAWTPEVTRALQQADREHGAFVAINCAVCHGPDGVGGSALAPSLKGLQAEVIWKQLHDYRSGLRQFPVMNAIARALEEQSILDVAAYFGTVGVPSRVDFRLGQDDAPPLVTRGDVRRGIPPCQACHGANNTDRRVMMAPQLEGQRADYIARQLGLFQTEWRRNDIYRPMREVAHALTAEEMRQIAEWYAAQNRLGAPEPSSTAVGQRAMPGRMAQQR